MPPHVVPVAAIRLIAAGAISLVVQGCGGTEATMPETTVVAPLPMPTYDGTLLASSRLATLPASDRSAWEAYVLTSRKQMGADQSLLASERTKAGLSATVMPPNTANDFAVSSSWTAAWVVTTAGKALVRAVLSFQTPSGGWGKHIDYAQGPRTAGMGFYSEGTDWSYVGTIDNGATVNELRLVAVAATAGDTAARSAFARGVNYLAMAQFPTGCFPQVYPLMGSYHDAATNNDDSSVNVLRFARDVAKGTWSWTTAATQSQAATIASKATDCLLAQQVVVNGTRTTWAQQHDPLTHAPVIGRSYELPGLAGREGARVMDALMEDPTPSAAVVRAVHAAAAFYQATAIPNVTYVSGTGLVPSAGAGPVWARIMEIGTNRAIFANRDGVLLYDFNQLTDRRTGYNWYGTEPATSLKSYATWATSHPAP
jgi:PelA/Pel-15E family pectate lyase